MSKGTERSEAQIDFNKRKNYSIYLFCDIYKGKWGGGCTQNPNDGSHLLTGTWAWGTGQQEALAAPSPFS